MGGDISGFLRMSGSQNNDDDTQYSYNSNSYSNRAAKRRKHYIETAYKTEKGINVDIDTGEILDFIPKPMRNNSRNFRSNIPKIPIPKPATIINLAIVGGVGLLAYKLYHQFFGKDASDINSDAAHKGSLALASHSVSDDKVKADTLNATATSLANNGLLPVQLHQSIALYFHNAMDTWWVDTNGIVNTILKQNVQTFRLASVAYGVKTLKTYCDWHITSFASKARNEGITLKDSLLMVLYDDDIKKIHAYLDVI